MGVRRIGGRPHLDAAAKKYCRNPLQRYPRCTLTANEPTSVREDVGGKTALHTAQTWAPEGSTVKIPGTYGWGPHIAKQRRFNGGRQTYLQKGRTGGHLESENNRKQNGRFELKPRGRCHPRGNCSGRCVPKNWAGWVVLIQRLNLVMQGASHVPETPEPNTQSWSSPNTITTLSAKDTIQ